MTTLIGLIQSLIGLYIWVLIGRVILEWVRTVNQSWRPRGIVLVLAEAVYTVTDPPIQAIRRVIPPLRLGSVALDLSFMVLVLGLSLVSRFLGQMVL